MANMNRISAQRVLEMASAIGIAMNPESAPEVMRVAGVPESKTRRAAFEAFHAKGMQSLRSTNGRGL